MKYDSKNKTLCVILHYGSVSDTDKCIRSLIKEKNIDIVISDNDPLQSYLPPVDLNLNISLFRTGGRSSFSEGNNFAVTKYLDDSYDSILLLNNDTIVAEGAINFLRETLYEFNIGMVGPCMPYADRSDKIWACGGYINKITLSIGGLAKLDQVPYSVDYLPGAAILCRSDLWVKIGGLSEKYFLAYEEAEFALEIKKLGYGVYADPRAIILHKVGMSKIKKPAYFYNDIRNRLRFSKYLYGSVLGGAYGTLMTLLLSIYSNFNEIPVRLSLWIHALADELKKKPLDKNCLGIIENTYGK